MGDKATSFGYNCLLEVFFRGPISYKYEWPSFWAMGDILLKSKNSLGQADEIYVLKYKIVLINFAIEDLTNYLS